MEILKVIILSLDMGKWEFTAAAIGENIPVEYT